MKKLISISLLAVGLSSAALADSQTFVIAPNTQSNLFPQSIKLLSMSVLATNAATITIYDAPGNTTTNIVGSYTTLSRYATNVSQVYTDFFGKPTTNWLTNAIVILTNSFAAQTNTYPQVFAQSYASNSTTTIPNISLLFVNGVLLTNNSGNTVTLTVQYTGN